MNGQTLYDVRCEDGKVRNREPFDTMADAMEWSWWGHCCTSNHRVVVHATCSMCGGSDHTERQRTEDGEWDEDCQYHSFVDGDGNDRRRSR